jgi:hypothetical protein
MSGSTIVGSIQTGITLGSGGYASPLTITSTGNVGPTAFGANGVYGSSSTEIVINDGVVAGALGGKYGFSGVAGTGIDLLGGTLTNHGSIIGGKGSVAGAGISLAAAAYADNLGNIVGGNGYSSNYSHGGSGAALSTGSSLSNNSIIVGGVGASVSGGFMPVKAATGGSGVTAINANITNSATIIGGGGGSGSLDFGGNGGDGVDLSHGSLTNTALIEGGNAGGGGIASGGNALNLGVGAVASNAGTLTGGSGSYGSFNRYGGGGFAGGGGNGALLTGGTLLNTGTITGGTDGTGHYPANGGAGVYINGGVLINKGTISGGVANSGGTAGAAVAFGTTAGTLVIYQTALLNGTVIANAAVADALELGSLATAETLSSLGTAYTNFSLLDVAAGARWTIGGSFAGAGGIYLGQASTVTSNVITESGVSLATSSYFINNALIQGSHSYGTRGHPPGNGGDGIDLSTNATMINAGTILAGIGANYYSRASGNGANGGTGAVISDGQVFNKGTIAGNHGGLGYMGGSQGLSGAGFSLSGIGTLNNTGMINGNSGAAGGTISGGVLINSGSINGGKPSGGGLGTAGAGLIMVAGLATNTGLIAAAQTAYGTGGNGVDILGGSLLNLATITSGQFNSIGEAAYVRAGSLTNRGLIQGGKFARGMAQLGGNVVNSGAIEGGTLSGTGVTLSGGSLNNAGTISGGAGQYTMGGAGIVISGGTMTNDGLLLGGAGGTNIYYNASGKHHSGNAGGAGLDLIGNVTIANAGTIIGGVGGGTVGGISYGYYGGAGVLLNAGTFIDSGTLEGGVGSANQRGQGGNGAAVQFGTGNAALVIAPGAAIDGAVAGFAYGDIIDFANVTINNETLVNNILALENNGAIIDTLSITGVQTADFTLASDGSNGTELLLGAQESFAGSSSTGIVLTALYTSIAPTAIVNVSGTALYGSSARNWTVVNHGTLENNLSGQNAGAQIKGGSTFTNAFGGLISGAYAGLVLGQPPFTSVSNLTNDGTIRSTGTGAFSSGLLFGGSGVITNQTGGIIEGSTAVALVGAVTLINQGTIESTGSNGAAIEFNQFFNGPDLIVIDPNSTIAGAINNFGTADTIMLDGFAVNTTSVSYVSGIGLELTSTAGTSITLDISGSFTTANFNVTGATSTTTITLATSVPCFAKGTHILTAAGEVRVEDLPIGAEIILFDGRRAPITWIGRRHIDIQDQPDPVSVLPILIQEGALADQSPVRDLYVSPDHALFFEGCLIPAKALINGHNIRTIECRTVTYYHVELAQHDILLAEGVAAESYLATGNRSLFENGGDTDQLPADAAQTMRQNAGCAPFIESGPVVERMRRQVLARARIETSVDPALMIVGQQSGAVLISSRYAIPGHIMPDPRDRRRLGVKISALRIGGVAVPLDHPALSDGWHNIEDDGRWTDGRAIVPAELAAGGEVCVHITATLPYPLRELPPPPKFAPMRL